MEMLTEERQQKILLKLEQASIVKTQDLIQQLSASESTIRRDLQELEDAGFLMRIHGGAKKKRLLEEEAALRDKTTKNTQEKLAIARFASQLIDKNDVIYLDAGSSTYHMISFLPDKKITVVTNSAQHAASLSELNVPTIMLGGTIKLKTNAIIGSTALIQLQHYRFDKVFLGTNGIDAANGFTTPDPEEAMIKEQAIKQGIQTFILADNSKFKQTFFSKIADVKEATIITDHCPTELHRPLKKLTTVLEVSQ
jgi:DeoR family fructose operon transcriptional repressor